MIGINKVQVLVIVIFIWCSINQSMAQEVQFNKNAIYGNLGSGGIYFTATGYYERMIKQKMWNTSISSFVKVGFGAEVHWGGESRYLLSQYGLLFGAKKHHLEIGLGPGYFSNNSVTGKLFMMSGTVGWRFQKPDGNFIFRIGTSWPEAVYAGLGLSF